MFVSTRSRVGEASGGSLMSTSPIIGPCSHPLKTCCDFVVWCSS